MNREGPSCLFISGVCLFIAKNLQVRGYLCELFIHEGVNPILQFNSKNELVARYKPVLEM